MPSSASSRHTRGRGAACSGSVFALEQALVRPSEKYSNRVLFPLLQFGNAFSSSCRTALGVRQATFFSSLRELQPEQHLVGPGTPSGATTGEPLIDGTHHLLPGMRGHSEEEGVWPCGLLHVADRPRKTRVEHGTRHGPARAASGVQLPWFRRRAALRRPGPRRRRTCRYTWTHRAADPPCSGTALPWPDASAQEDRGRFHPPPLTSSCPSPSGSA